MSQLANIEVQNLNYLEIIAEIGIVEIINEQLSRCAKLITYLRERNEERGRRKK